VLAGFEGEADNDGKGDGRKEQEMVRIGSGIAWAACAAILGGVSISAMAMQQPASAPAVSIGGTTKAEEAAVNRWIADTRAVLQSEKFHDNLKSLAAAYPEIWLSQYLKYRSPAALSQILKLQDPNKPNARFAPASLALIGAPAPNASADDGYDGNDDAFTGWTGYVEAGKSNAAMRIGRVHYDRYINGNVVARSCAINTLAHETSHTLSHDSNQYLEYFLDTNDASPDKPGVPVASYLIGSLAQCTYLQNQNRIKDADLKSCLATFGIDQFYNTRCDDFAGATADIKPPSPPPSTQPPRISK
jgi:hypothetical protein